MSSAARLDASWAKKEIKNPRVRARSNQTAAESETSLAKAPLCTGQVGQWARETCVATALPNARSSIRGPQEGVLAQCEHANLSPVRTPSQPLKQTTSIWATGWRASDSCTPYQNLDLDFMCISLRVRKMLPMS